MPMSANEHVPEFKSVVARFNPASILDVGMGYGNYGWYLRNECNWRGMLHGIEVWEPYTCDPNYSNSRHYDSVHIKDVREAFDYINTLQPELVLAFDVIEHFSESEGVKILRHLQRASKYGVLVSLPIIPYPQGPYLGNPHEEHLKDWTVQEMMALGSEFLHRGGVTGLFHFPGGRLDRRISVILNTARDDDSFDFGHLKHRVLLDPAEALCKQTVPPDQIEFIAVDGLFEHRQKTFEAHSYPLRILHMPPKPSQMVKDKRCAISAYKNTGLAHMRAPLGLTIDDGSVLPPTFLANVIEAWEARREMLSGMYYGLDFWGNPEAGESFLDSRKVYLDANGKCVGPINGNFMIPPMYGFAALPLEAVIKVNGYDEMFDGSRGLEDSDMGIRLQRAGFKVSVDAKHTFGILPHRQWSTKVFGDNMCGGEPKDAEKLRISDPNANLVDTTCVKCCQTTFRLRIDEVLAGDYVVNRKPWSDDKWNRVAPRCYLLSEGHCSLNGHKCPHVGNFSDQEHPGLQSLRSNPPIFDLANERFFNGIR